MNLNIVCVFFEFKIYEKTKQFEGIFKFLQYTTSLNYELADF